MFNTLRRPQTQRCGSHPDRPGVLLVFQAGEENPEVQLSVVSLNGPLHTVVMKKPDDPRIG